MELKIKIGAPRGYGAEKLMRPDFQKLICGFAKVKETYINKEGDTMIWILEATPKQYHGVLKKVAMYSTLVNAVFSNTLVKAAMKPGQDKELRDLLERTKIEVIKNATAQEMVEDNKTWFQRIKETWSKINSKEDKKKWQK